jgi:rSAM/selenodomain-associated transferase 2
VKISVVIPALDESEEVAGAIGSAAPSVVGSVEVCVVDGGSRDDTTVRARSAGARVEHSQPGRARQLQVGVEATEGEVLLFLHADTRLPRGWDLALRQALRRPDAHGGAFHFRFEGRRGVALRIVEWGARVRVALFGLPYGDQAIFLRREVLERIGGVPQVPLLEDLDLVRAIKQRGRLVALPLEAITSARRYRAGGVVRTMLRHWVVAAAWTLGADRHRIAAWYAAGGESAQARPPAGRRPAHSEPKASEVESVEAQPSEEVMGR